MLAQGRLTSPDQFGNIVVRETPNGGTVRVRDVARVELGAQYYNLVSRLNGKPTAVIAVYQLPGSNAVQTSAGVRKLMSQMKQGFPEDIDYATSLDQTRPVTEGMKEILETLLIAIVLVILVVYLFLQDWRATLIPMLAVPVSLVGTFVLFPLFGFSINTLSLFGLVLAIGLVVDDAIVVVEGVQHHIEEGLVAEGRGAKGHGGALRPRDWHCAGTLRGLCAHHLHPGHYRKALSAIRDDHCHLGGAVRLQRAHAQSRSGGIIAAAQACAKREGAPWDPLEIL